MTARLDYRASSARTRPAVATVTALAIVKDPWIWTTLAVRGHPYEEADMPAAHVVFVRRTEVLPDGRLSDRLAGSPAGRAGQRAEAAPMVQRLACWYGESRTG